MKDSYEESGVKIISDLNFIKKLHEYEYDSVNEETIELLEPFIYQQKEWFNDAFAVRASKASSCILKWIMGIFEYHQISKIAKSKFMLLSTVERRLFFA